ncbi:MAG: PEP-CTERM sorting domain-containing protein [Roseateles sp.]
MNHRPLLTRLAAALLALASPGAQADLSDELPDPDPTAPPPGMPTPDLWWTGGKPDLDGNPYRWSKASNWTATLAAGRALGFGAAGGSATSFNDVRGATYRSISFTGSTAYVLQGEALAVTDGLYNGSSVMQTLHATVSTSAQSRTQTWNGGTAGLTVNLGGTLYGSLTLNKVQASATGPLRFEVGNGLNLGAPLTLDLRNSQLTSSGASLSGSLPPDGARVLMTASQWNNTGELALGTTSRKATLNIDATSKLRTDQLVLGSTGTLTLAGGQLSFASLSRSGVLDWQRGAVQARGALALGALGSNISLGSQRQLEVQGTLTVNSGERLSLAAGSNALKATTLRLAGGTLQADGPLGSDVPLLSGHGRWQGRVSGSTSIQASGGRLQLGDAQLTGAVNLQGPLSVAAGASVQFDSADLAQLGSRTALAQGASLVAANGVVLGRGETLTVSNAAEIQGRFVNDGSVSTVLPIIGTSGVLHVTGEVSGTGSFRGRLDLLGGLSPGGDLGAGVGTLDFGGGELWLGADGVLTLDIGQQGGQWTGDRLANIGVLHAGGALKLRLNGADPALAGSWQGLSFGSIAGQFSRITLEGAEGWTLDTAQLMTSGRVSISPVPEPTSALLMLLGLAALPWCRRRMQG